MKAQEIMGRLEAIQQRCLDDHSPAPQKGKFIPSNLDSSTPLTYSILCDLLKHQFSQDRWLVSFLRMSTARYNLLCSFVQNREHSFLEPVAFVSFVGDPQLKASAVAFGLSTIGRKDKK